MQSCIFQKDIYKVDAVICKMYFMSREELNILVINSGFPNLEAIAQKIVILIMVKIILFKILSLLFTVRLLKIDK